MFVGFESRELENGNYHCLYSWLVDPGLLHDIIWFKRVHGTGVLDVATPQQSEMYDTSAWAGLIPS